MLNVNTCQRGGWVQMLEEVQSQETKIALINQNIQNINRNVDEIRLDIKGLNGIFVPTMKYEEDRKALELRVSTMEKSGNLWKWLSPTLAATMGSVLTLLVSSYLQHLK
jgi:hypothetical protein